MGKKSPCIHGWQRQDASDEEEKEADGGQPAQSCDCSLEGEGGVFQENQAENSSCAQTC